MEKNKLKIATKKINKKFATTSFYPIYLFLPYFPIFVDQKV